MHWKFQAPGGFSDDDDDEHNGFYRVSCIDCGGRSVSFEAFV